MTDILAHLIDSVTINQVSYMDGKIIKRRKPGRGWMIAIGNIFLKWSNSHIEMFPNTSDWQCWEYECYQHLYGGGCQPLGRHALLITPFEGTSIRHMIKDKTINDVVMQSIGLEFKRVHQLNDWSHGDPHTGNVLWHDEQARLIDFETRHRDDIDVDERHADDLLAFLLDYLGQADAKMWFEHCQALLLAYDDKHILQTLQKRLYMPSGLEQVLWKSRSDFLPYPILEKRIIRLNQWIGNIDEKDNP